MSEKSIKIPDLGGISEAILIEWLVSPGDRVEVDTPLATLESEKATMDVPSASAGIIDRLVIDTGERVSEGTIIGYLKAEDQTSDDTQVVSEPEVQTVDVAIPDLGGIDQASVLEVLVEPDSKVSIDDPLLTLESDKASMDVPSPVQGKIISIHVSVGDQVTKGTLVARVLSESSDSQSREQVVTTPVATTQAAAPTIEMPMPSADRAYKVSSPIVRRLAFELDISLDAIKGSGRGGRISKADLIAYIKSKMSGPSAKALPDFSQFGSVKEQPIGKIKKFSGPHLQNSWQTIPHVTQFFEADLTDLEAYRQRVKGDYIAQGTRLTPIVFFMQALVQMLKEHPIFASSLSADGTSLWMKSYYHVGIAVDTDDGLVVPVIKNVDQKSTLELSKELVELSQLAREGKLKPAQMQGGTVTISSLGGIGGTWFTPIINAPEVCILGVSKAFQKPVYIDGQFVPRYTVPLSLSYDHRVIDGAEAARFAMQLQSVLENMHTTIE